MKLRIEQIQGDPHGPPRIVFDEIAWDFPDIDWKTAVAFGIRYALRKLGFPVRPSYALEVHVTVVGGYMLDTSELTLAYAAAQAVWNAFAIPDNQDTRIEAQARSIAFSIRTPTSLILPFFPQRPGGRRGKPGV